MNSFMKKVEQNIICLSVSKVIKKSVESFERQIFNFVIERSINERFRFVKSRIRENDRRTLQKKELKPVAGSFVSRNRGLAAAIQCTVILII